jgi:hypothetical protein
MTTQLLFFSLSIYTGEGKTTWWVLQRKGEPNTVACVSPLGSNGRRFFFSRPSPTVLYIYIYRKKTLLIFTSSSLCVCVLSSSLSATSRLLWRRNIRRSVPRESKEKCFPFFLSICFRLYTSV